MIGVYDLHWLARLAMLLRAGESWRVALRSAQRGRWTDNWCCSARNYWGEVVCGCQAATVAEYTAYSQGEDPNGR